MEVKIENIFLCIAVDISFKPNTISNKTNNGTILPNQMNFDTSAVLRQQYYTTRPVQYFTYSNVGLCSSN